MEYTLDDIMRMEQSRLVNLIDTGVLILKRDALDVALKEEILATAEVCGIDITDEQATETVQTIHDDEWLWSEIIDRIRYHIKDFDGKEDE